MPQVKREAASAGVDFEKASKFKGLNFVFNDRQNTATNNNKPRAFPVSSAIDTSRQHMAHMAHT